MHEDANGSSCCNTMSFEHVLRVTFPWQVAVSGASYARLANAAREDPDPLPEVQDAWHFLVAALEAFSKVPFRLLLAD